MSTIPDPATTDWVPLGAAAGLPLPVVNGQWIKGVSGLPVWSAIARADVAGGVGLQVIDDYVVTGSVLAAYDTNVRLGTNSIPQTYRDLILHATGNSDGAAQQLLCQINGLTSGYYWERFYVAGAAANTITPGEGVNVTSWEPGFNGASVGIGFSVEITLPNYTGAAPPTAAGNKHFRSEFWSAHNNNTGTLRRGSAAGAISANPIVRLLLQGAGGTNFQTGTRFTLYGRG